MIKDAKLHPNTRLYMDYGSIELRNHRGMNRIFNKVTSLLLKEKVYITSRIVPYGDHCEACWEQQVPFFMNILLYEGFR